MLPIRRQTMRVLVQIPAHRSCLRGRAPLGLPPARGDIYKGHLSGQTTHGTVPVLPAVMRPRIVSFFFIVGSGQNEIHILHPIIRRSSEPPRQ